MAGGHFSGTTYLGVDINTHSTYEAAATSKISSIRNVRVAKRRGDAHPVDTVAPVLAPGRL